MSTEPRSSLAVAADPTLAGSAALAPTRRRRLHAGRKVRRNQFAVVGLSVMAFFTAFCILGPFIYHTDQVHTSLISANLAPGMGGHVLGTDDFGYDELGRLMVGGQSSLEVGIVAAILAVVFGALWGAIAGYVGGFVDNLMMRFVDAMIAIPWLFLLLFLASITTLNVPLMILVVAITGWLGPARLIRAESLSLRTRDYVQAVRVMGGGASRIVLRHIVPNAIGTMIVSATFHVGEAILTVATLSYLHLGPPAPSGSWGSMLSNGIQFTLDGYWWMIVPPGIAIILIVLAFNFLGEWLGERFAGQVTS